MHMNTLVYVVQHPASNHGNVVPSWHLGQACVESVDI